MISIDATYFEFAPVKINGITEDGNDVNLSDLNRAIKRFTEQYLKQLLGKEVYVEYKADSAVEGSTKWKPLEDMLVNTEDKISPISNYIFYYFRRENYLEHGTTGDFKDKMDNMQVVSPVYRMVMAWNDGVSMNEKVCDWIVKNIINAETPLIAISGRIESYKWFCDDGLLKYKSVIGEFI